MTRRTIFILGAGASREAGAPLMNDFLDVADTVREGQAPGTQLREQVDLVFKGIAALDPVFAKSDIEVRNIESVVAAFEMADLFGRLGDLKQVEVHRLPSAIKSLIVTTLESRLNFRVGDGQLHPPLPYEQFVNLLRELQKHPIASTPPPPKVTVMTFNYELALDYALQFSAVPFSYNLTEADANGMSLLKLHGSFNWSRCQNRDCNALSVTPVERLTAKIRTIDPFGRGSHLLTLPLSTYLPQCSKCHVPNPPEPLIVPPTWNKTQHYAGIKNVWSVAAHQLSEAENIVIIGYSLPATDHFFRYLFALGAVGATRLKRFVVVNPDPYIVKRFEPLLGPVARDRLMHIPSSFSEGINRLQTEFRR